MKTTSGKTKHPRRAGRLVYIYSDTRRGVIAQFNARSLRAALEQYAETWLANGWQAAYVGNTLQLSRGDNVRNYTALETYQSP